MKIITRFSPSPTGSLHIGSVRTAFYSWLFARRYNGIFILRIEDTDLNRSTNKSVLEIFNNLNLLGLHWDKGPYFQTKRISRYKNFIFFMLKKKLAYKCYCTKERLTKLRNYQIKNNIKPKYDRKCRNKNFSSEYSNNSYVVRFKNPKSGVVSFVDKIRGLIQFSNSELDDLIIQRSNGIPTYNFCVVIDDLDSGVTHVIRGEDHINNTPRQINILNALNAKIPVYAHLSMVLDRSGKKLSKRNNVLSIEEYLKNGFLSSSILNYIFRLGWASGNQEIFTLKDMIKNFSLKNIGNSPSIFNEKKLLWFNNYYIKNTLFKFIRLELQKKFKKYMINVDIGPKLESVFDLLKMQCSTLDEIVIKSFYFYKKVNYFHCVYFKKFINNKIYYILHKLYVVLKNIIVWDIYNLSKTFKNICLFFKLSLKDIIVPVRIILTGSISSPSIYIIMCILKKEETLQRIMEAMYYYKKNKLL
ncbi:glutamate--tRNA ligase [Buchnera aphidicola (Mollitrichosiphum nigrofasciatum)]|uniref:glutamate--tRNA ligase n=1 Tax=Buchnera aphidicola TaxID=9 RepID=UPI0031B7EB1C